MKTNFRHLLAAACCVTFLLVSSGCNKDHVSPDAGSLVTTTRTVPAFTGIEVADGFDVTLTKGPAQEVKIEGGEGYQPYLVSEVVGGVLKIRVDDKLDTDQSKVLHAFITVPTLSSITATGGTDISSTDDLQPRDLALSLSGGSSIQLPLTAQTVSVASSGGSIINLTGAAQSLTASQLSGASKLRTVDLVVATATLNAAGGSTAEVQATDALAVTAAGGSIIRYRGTPRITQNLSGGSQVVPF